MPASNQAFARMVAPGRRAASFRPIVPALARRGAPANAPEMTPEEEAAELAKADKVLAEAKAGAQARANAKQAATPKPAKGPKQGGKQVRKPKRPARGEHGKGHQARKRPPPPQHDDKKHKVDHEPVKVKGDHDKPPPEPDIPDHDVELEEPKDHEAILVDSEDREIAGILKSAASSAISAAKGQMGAAAKAVASGITADARQASSQASAAAGAASGQIASHGAAAQGQVASAASSAQGQVSSKAAAEHGKLSAWEGATSAKVESDLDASAEQVTQAGEQAGEQADEAGEQAGEQVESGAQAASAKASGASPGAGGELTSDAKADVKSNVGGKAASDISSQGSQAASETKSKTKEVGQKLTEGAEKGSQAVKDMVGPSTQAIGQAGQQGTQQVQATASGAKADIAGQANAAKAGIAASTASSQGTVKAAAHGAHAQAAGASQAGVQGVRNATQQKLGDMSSEVAGILADLSHGDFDKGDAEKFAGALKSGVSAAAGQYSKGAEAGKLAAGKLIHAAVSQAKAGMQKSTAGAQTQAQGTAQGAKSGTSASAQGAGQGMQAASQGAQTAGDKIAQQSTQGGKQAATDSKTKLTEGAQKVTSEGQKVSQKATQEADKGATETTSNVQQGGQMADQKAAEEEAKKPKKGGGILGAIKNFASKVFDWLKGAVTAVVNYVKENWKDLLVDIALAVATIALVATLGPAGLAIAAGLNAVVEGVRTYIKTGGDWKATLTAAAIGGISTLAAPGIGRGLSVAGKAVAKGVGKTALGQAAKRGAAAVGSKMAATAAKMGTNAAGRVTVAAGRMASKGAAAAGRFATKDAGDTVAEGALAFGGTVAMNAATGRDDNPWTAAAMAMGTAPITNAIPFPGMKKRGGTEGPGPGGPVPGGPPHRGGPDVDAHGPKAHDADGAGGPGKGPTARGGRDADAPGPHKRDTEAPGPKRDRDETHAGGKDKTKDSDHKPDKGKDKDDDWTDQLPDPYAGVKEASRMLREAGVPRRFRREALQSFEVDTIKVQKADDQVFGIRHHGGVSGESGRYLAPTLPSTRPGTALPPGNTMEHLTQFQIRPGSTYIAGRAGPNFGHQGGQHQYYVPDLADIKPARDVPHDSTPYDAPKADAAPPAKGHAQTEAPPTGGAGGGGPSGPPRKPPKGGDRKPGEDPDRDPSSGREPEGEGGGKERDPSRDTGMRDETREALADLESVKRDPIGDVNSIPNHNHYSAARREANGEVVARRPDGKPFDHIADLQQAVDRLYKIRRKLQREIDNPPDTLTSRGIDVLDAKLREVDRMINRANGFLNSIGHGDWRRTRQYGLKPKEQRGQGGDSPEHEGPDTDGPDTEGPTGGTPAPQGPKPQDGGGGGERAPGPASQRELDEQLNSMFEPDAPGKGRQPATTEEELFDANRRNMPKFNDILEMTGRDVGIEPAKMDMIVGGDVDQGVSVAPLKGADRAREKVEGKYDGDWSKLTDVGRATIAVPHLKDIPSVVAALQRRAKDAGWEITAPENRWTAPDGTPLNTGPTVSGYRDVSMLLKAPDGTQMELQINTVKMLRAKEKTHKLYEEERSLNEMPEEKKTPEIRARIEQLRRQQRQIHEEAAEGERIE